MKIKELPNWYSYLAEIRDPVKLKQEIAKGENEVTRIKRCCKHCTHFRPRNILDPDERYGDCECPLKVIKVPDCLKRNQEDLLELFQVAVGEVRHKVRQDQGRQCPCYEQHPCYGIATVSV